MTENASSTERSAERVAILSSLHQTEISANVGELQSGSSLILGSMAYFAATVLVVRDDKLGFEFLLLLPLGVLFLCAYHLLRTAVVVRRASLARHYERALFVQLGSEQEKAFDEGRLGSPYYGRVDDVGLLLAMRPPGWLRSVIVASFSYFGIYGLALLYSGLVIQEAWQRSDSALLVVLAALGYLLLFLVYAGFAAKAFFQPQPQLEPLDGPDSNEDLGSAPRTGDI